MSFATRCPECQTLFKVTLGQLQVREGQVRCGQCKAVFSGIDHLTAADTELWQQTKLTADASAPPPNTPPEQAAFLAPKAKAKAPTFLKRLTSAWNIQPKATRMLTLGLSTLIILQFFWIQRVSLLTSAPTIATAVGSQPMLSGLLATAPSRSLIVAGSGLDRISSSQLQLELTLQNGSSLPSKWPHIKVELIDVQGQPIAAKVLTPSDYEWRPPVGSNAKSRPPLVQSGELIELRAQLNTAILETQLSGQTPSGFNVQVFDQSMPLL